MSCRRYLKARKWRGGIKIRDERGTLTIFAQQDSSAGRAETDLKTLSGGERSFVTVCYLLALCKKLQGSFHALDEFDVFMDNVNRGVSACLNLNNAWLFSLSSCWCPFLFAVNIGSCSKCSGAL